MVVRYGLDPTKNKNEMLQLFRDVKYQLLGPTVVHLELELYLILSLFLLMISSYRGLYKDTAFTTANDIWYFVVTFVLLSRHLLIRYICLNLDNTTLAKPTILGFLTNIYQTYCTSGSGHVSSLHRPTSYQQVSYTLSSYQRKNTIDTSVGTTATSKNNSGSRSPTNRSLDETLSFLVSPTLLSASDYSIYYDFGAPGGSIYRNSFIRGASSSPYILGRFFPLLYLPFPFQYAYQYIQIWIYRPAMHITTTILLRILLSPLSPKAQHNYYHYHQQQQQSAFRLRSEWAESVRTDDTTPPGNFFRNRRRDGGGVTVSGRDNAFYSIHGNRQVGSNSTGFGNIASARIRLLWIRFRNTMSFLYDCLVHAYNYYIPSVHFILWLLVGMYICNRLSAMKKRLPDSLYSMFFASNDEVTKEIYSQVIQRRGRMVNINENIPGYETVLLGSNPATTATSDGMASLQQQKQLIQQQTAMMVSRGLRLLYKQPKIDQVVFVLCSFTTIACLLFFVRLTLPIPDLIAGTTAVGDIRNTYKHYSFYYDYSSTSGANTRSGPRKIRAFIYDQILRLFYYLVGGPNFTRTAGSNAFQDASGGGNNASASRTNSVSNNHTAGTTGSKKGGHHRANPADNHGYYNRFSVYWNYILSALSLTSTSSCVSETTSWNEKMRPLPRENRIHLTVQVTILRIIENIFICCFMPRSNFICRYTTHCTDGPPLWDLSLILYPAGVVMNSRREDLSFFGYMESDAQSGFWTFIGVVFVTFNLLFAQAIVLKRSYLSTLGYLSCQWEKIGQDERIKRNTREQGNVLMPSKNESDEQERIALENKLAFVETWDPRRSYQKGDLVYYPTNPSSSIYTALVLLWLRVCGRNNTDPIFEQRRKMLLLKNLYRATVDQPQSYPFNLELRSLNIWLRGEVGHISTSFILQSLIKYQFIGAVASLLWYGLNYVRYDTANQSYGLIFAVLAQFVSLHGLLNSVTNPNIGQKFHDINGCGNLQKLSQEISAR